MKHTIKNTFATIGIICSAFAAQGLAVEKPTNPPATAERKVDAPEGAKEEPLEQLRQQYQQARDHLANTENPDFDDPKFQEKLTPWAQAYQKSNQSAQALIVGLLDAWIALPKGSPEAEPVGLEIKQVFKDLGGEPGSEQYNLAKSFMARTAWPLLAGHTLTREQAGLLVELAEPQALVRLADKMARVGLRYESIGWDVQAAYALALMCSGDDKKARDEIAILHRKVSMQHKFNPKGRLDYGSEAGAGRYRNYTDYLQLCEALYALQAATSNDREGAKKHIENARKLREALSPEVAPLVTEVARRAKTDKN
jgi:hypothetical protein